MLGYHLNMIRTIWVCSAEDWLQAFLSAEMISDGNVRILEDGLRCGTDSTFLYLLGLDSSRSNKPIEQVLDNIANGYCTILRALSDRLTSLRLLRKNLTNLAWSQLSQSADLRR